MANKATHKKLIPSFYDIGGAKKMSIVISALIISMYILQEPCLILATICCWTAVILMVAMVTNTAIELFRELKQSREQNS